MRREKTNEKVSEVDKKRKQVHKDWTSEDMRKAEPLPIIEVDDEDETIPDES